MKTFWKIVFGSLLGCLVAMLVAMFCFFGMMSSMASASMNSGQASKTGSVLRIDKSTIISERAVDVLSVTALMNRQNGARLSLLDAVRAIDAAADDPAIKFIYMNTDDLSWSISNAEEVRAALARFRASGKAIVAYGENFDVLSYYVASVADKVVANADGTAMITGIATQSIYLKDLLDKLGVEMQLIRHGKFKSAGEMYIKNAMSDENRLQLQAMVDGMWNTIADEICASRDFSREELDAWIENLELDKAQSMLDRKMVDTIYFAD